MITRLVIMSFREEAVEDFLQLFDEHKELIRGVEGCEDLKLIQNTRNPTEISTLSRWKSERHLNNYRNSELFGKVWPATKKLFESQPEATSFEEIHHL